MCELMRHTVLLSMLFLVNDADAAERTVIPAVENMTCATCPPIVRKSLARVPGVGHVSVSADTNTATIVFDDEKTSLAALIDATTKAGYPSRLRK